MAVKVSGAVLASLFYDQTSSYGDQWGFLVGETVQHVKDTISDSQINNVQVETNTYIFDCVSLNRDMFNKLSSDMTRQDLVDLLPGRHQNIVGWYSFRRNSTLRPSYRERLFHQRLESLASIDSSLLFCLSTAKASSNNSTHTLDHIVLHLENNIFKKKSVDIINLGDTTHTDYLTIPSHTVSSKHGAFNNIIKKHEKEFLNADGDVEIKKIQQLNKAISRQLQAISHEVVDSESRCSVLEREISRLRTHTKLKMLEKQQQQQVPSHKHRANTQAQGARERSVDDILSMDISDDTSNVEALIDQPSSLNSTHSNGDSNNDDDDNSETMDTDSDSVIHHNTDNCSITEHKLSSREGKQKTVPSGRSDCDNKHSVNHSHSKTKSNSSNTRQETRPKHPADPFSYVGDMMAQASMKSSTRSKTSSSVLKKDIDYHGDSKMEEDGVINQKGNVGKVKTEDKSAKVDRNSKLGENRSELNKSSVKNGQAYIVDDNVSSDDSSSLEPTSSPVY